MRVCLNVWVVLEATVVTNGEGGVGADDAAECAFVRAPAARPEALTHIGL